MGRAPFNALIVPFRMLDGRLEYAVTRRSDNGDWQFLSGGGEGTETPLSAAQREAYEEGGIPQDTYLIELDSTASVPATCFSCWKEWGDDVYVVTEFSFGVDLTGRSLVLSDEHTDVQWLEYDEASKLLTFDSNRIAMWELSERLKRDPARS
jgi:dihydroneopterin triphosphate diphosphatase